MFTLSGSKCTWGAKKDHPNCAFFHETWKADNCGQKSLGHFSNLMKLSVFKVKFKNGLHFPAPPIQCWKSDGIVGSFQHCIGDGGGEVRQVRLYSCLTCAQKPKSANWSHDSCPWLQMLGPPGSLSVWLVIDQFFIRKRIEWAGFASSLV